MITRLQTIFLKHNKWLFGGLLVVIIVTFVLTIGPQSFFGSQGTQKRKSLNYYGYNLSSESDQRAMALTAEISAILHPELQMRRDQVMDYAYMRAAALGIANQIGIPEAGEAELKDFISTLAIFNDPQTGEFSATAYNSIMEALKTNSRYSREAVARVIREDYRITQLREALGGPDYTLPFELKQDYVDATTSYTVELIHFPYEGFSPEIAPTDEELENFYKENPSRYEIPETLSVTSLMFVGQSYLDEVEAPTEQDLEAYFTANKAKYKPEKPADAEEETAPAEVVLDDVREKVTEDWSNFQARQIAARKGEEFSVRLWRDTIKLGSPEYQALLEEYQVVTQDIPPYTRNLPPRMDEASAQLLNSMWVYANNPTRYFSDVSPTSNGAEILVSRGLTEARMPEFSEVKDRVTSFYMETEKRRLFSEKGKEIRETIESRLPSESLEDIAADLGLEVEALEPFTGATPPQPLLTASLWDQARYLGKGEISPMVMQRDRGSFAYMTDKTVPEIDEESTEYQEYLAQRTGTLSESMGWSRLREISDRSLEALVGTTDLN